VTFPLTLVARPGGPSNRRGEPVRIGVPLPAGQCFDADSLGIEAAHGIVNAQARALDWWPDGSIRWALVDFEATVESGTDPKYRVAISSRRFPRTASIVTPVSNGVDIDTGVVQIAVRRRGAFPFASIIVDGRPALDPACSALAIELADGRTLKAHVKQIEIEEDGPVRATVRVEGTAGRALRRPLRFELRLTCFAGSGTVRMALTLRNPNRAKHRGGIWTLGDPGSVLIKDASILLAAPDDGRLMRLRCSLEAGEPLSDAATPWGVYQESSGGANWLSPVHRNRFGFVPHRRQGYRLRAGNVQGSGRRATPILELSSGDRTLAVAVPQFWQNFPKAIECDGRAIALRLFPWSYPDSHELQGGEQKTHEWYVAFAPDRVTSEPLAWCCAPLVARLEPEAYAASGAVRYLTPNASDPDREYVALVNEGIDGAHAFERKRELIDEYGWRNFGEVYADHENALHTGNAPLVSHYNNQYDLIFGFACQFLRSGDVRWWELMSELASHVGDIDIYHTDRDKAAYNHGLFWHTFHYVDAGTATHRSYPRDPRVGGGGPSAEHNYASGFVLHYFLTGDLKSRNAAIGLADWVLAMDDGSRSRFRWIDRGATGLASATASPLYHGPGRGAGHSILALLDGYRLSRNPDYLDKIEELIRRCVHPEDDVDARRLDDIEARWSYTAFLQALGRYLDDKAEFGEIDEDYAYARASLLRYARWMLQHEYIYLQEPQRLEYPTETWAAQELRKACVFRYAMMHAPDDERDAFAERASFFHRAALEELARHETKACARPLALLMSHGYQEAYFATHPGVRAPLAAEEPPAGTPERFVPQKVRALRRAAAILVGVAAATLAGLATLE